MSSRIKNTKRNILVGLINRVTSIILPFLIRTAILWILGVEYMGLNSLFTSILNVLNLAELGFSSSIVFSMYKPIAEDDKDTICALMAYYKNVYRFTGTFIGIVGVLILPFMNKLINGAWPVDINIYLLYLIYLFNTVISYFLFAYKSSLLNAFQRIDLVNKVQLITLIGQYLIQLCLLLLFKDYYLYIIITPISTVACNLITSYLTDKHFPQYKCRGKISKELKDDIQKQVGGLMLGKLSDTSRNSFDSIVLSAMFGLTVVAIYNNYFYIYSALYGIVITITQAMQASVGNSIASETAEKNYEDLRKFTFIFGWIAGWCSICMFCLYQHFMSIWVGDDLLLSNLDMILFCVYFYAINMNNSRNLYFSGRGLWWAGKKTFIYEAVGNLFLNILLGITLGTTGVLLATIITIFLFNFIFRTNILFDKYFHNSPYQFYRDHIIYAVTTLVFVVATYYVCSFFAEYKGVGGLTIKAIICVIVPNILYLVIYCRNNQFQKALELVKYIIKQ